MGMVGGTNEGSKAKQTTMESRTASHVNLFRDKHLSQRSRPFGAVPRSNAWISANIAIRYWVTALVYSSTASGIPLPLAMQSMKCFLLT